MLTIQHDVAEYDLYTLYCLKNFGVQEAVHYFSETMRGSSGLNNSHVVL